VQAIEGAPQQDRNVAKRGDGHGRADRILSLRCSLFTSEHLSAWERWMVGAVTIGTPLDERNVRREFDSILTAAKLPRIRIHDLRHTCASLLLVQGVHPRVVMERLGHSQSSLTLTPASGPSPA
jgi:integrase